jgi:hypothetical protein
MSDLDLLDSALPWNHQPLVVPPFKFVTIHVPRVSTHDIYSRCHKQHCLGDFPADAHLNLGRLSLDFPAALAAGLASMQGTSILLVALAHAGCVSAAWSAMQDNGLLKGYSTVFQQKPPVSFSVLFCSVSWRLTCPQDPPPYMVDNTDNLSGQAPNKGKLLTKDPVFCQCLGSMLMCDCFCRRRVQWPRVALLWQF